MAGGMSRIRYPGPDEGLHESFARIAQSGPDAPALVSGRHTTTYGELDRTADAWAAQLVAAGVTPGGRVPILLPRSAELVTALLAALKAGAAYALLDPAWPTDRLGAVIAELGAPLLVTEPGADCGWALPVWSPSAGPVVVPAGFRPVAVGGSAPASVFFTSGTTGRPKGVLTTHRATARLFQPDSFARFAADTVVPLAAPMPWDAFSLELWSALLNGGTSVIVDEPYLSAGALRSAVSAHGVNTVWLTSSLFNMIVDEDPDAFRDLGQVMTGGERLSAAHVRRFLRRYPEVWLLNGYGPVESTVFATTHRITRADCERPGGIPLGRSVPGTQIHVLDGSRTCAVDEPGEICISGDGLALRYLGDAALTDEKFTMVALDGGFERVYRTGDLGLWGADGLLHFRGRADRQLKVRGHRIEPADIEHRIEQVLSRVRSCRVLARRDRTGAAQELVAFCVPAEPGDPLDGAASALGSALLPHERPAAVVSVEAYPVTAHGKLDEPALLAMAPAGRDGTAEAPDDPTQLLVAETFSAVLGRATVPLDTSFLDIGGNSLGAGRVCARLASRLGRPVPVSRLYQHPSVNALAGWLRSTERITPGPGSADLVGVPLTPMQLVYLTRNLRDPSDRTSHCQLIWVVEGEPDRRALESAIAAVHRRHEALRAAYTPDPRPAARLVDVAPPALEVLPGQPSVDAAIAALRTRLAAPLEIGAGSVWRTALVPAGASTVFGCVVHHIAFDGWSESVLADDLSRAYNAGRPLGASPPSLSTIHREYAEHLAQVDFPAQHAYLRGELPGVAALQWPVGPERAPWNRAPDLVEVVLPPAVVAGVDAGAAETGVTRFMLMLSHCAGSLAEVTGQRDFLVGVPVARRYGTVLDRVVGCHITMVCVRMRGAALGSGVAAVKKTGQIAARAFAAQDVPLADVLDLVERPPRGRPAPFQTLFALQDNAIPRLELGGLRTTFRRQPHLDLPLDLHTELWPEVDGGLRLTVHFRPEAVADATARAFAKRFTERLHAELRVDSARGLR